MASGTLSDLLQTLQSSLESAQAALPDEDRIAPPPDGISLLDTKNELFLSYLQNLVFLILFKIRQLKDGSINRDLEGSQKEIWDQTVKNLITLRVYSERGVRPLENKLRYEIERVLQAAEDAENSKARKASKQSGRKKKSQRSEERNAAHSDDEDIDGSDDEDAEPGLTDDEDGSEDEDEDGEDLATRMSALRPNLATLRIPGASTASAASRDNARGDGDEKPGVYRPPRVSATTMPTTDANTREKSRRERTAARSSTLEDYLADEVSGAPGMEVSVGSNIQRAGRAMTTTSQRRQAEERREYEETNFVRLPGLSKKERQKQRARSGGRDDGAMRNGFGGEDWRDLGAGAERVMRDIDSRKKASARHSVADSTLKRHRDAANDGTAGKSRHEKRVKIMSRKRR